MADFREFGFIFADSEKLTWLKYCSSYVGEGSARLVIYNFSSLPANVDNFNLIRSF